MKNTFSLLFYLKKPKNYTGGIIPVYMRITIAGKRIEISTQRNCDPEKWNSYAGRMIGNKEEVRIFNNYLDTLQVKVFETHRQLVASNETVTLEHFKQKYFGISEKPRMLVEIYEHHNKQFEELVGKEFSEGTLKKFKTCKLSIEEFLKWKYQASDFNIRNLGFEFVNDYEFYLKSVKNCAHNTVMGYIKKLKKIVRQCVAKNWLDKDPFMAYKVSIRETHRTILTEEELYLINEKEFATPRMELVRDIFLFSCFTGLAYSDVEKLTPLDVVNGIDGQKWIHTTRTKTNTASRVPLIPIALEIINKYRGHPKVSNSNKILPILSNQRMNSYLKELADVCGINKELTFHCARHTFATIVTLSNGVPIESVGKMLGQKSLRTTQIYAKVLDRKVSDDMKNVKEKFKLMSQLTSTQETRYTGINKEGHSTLANKEETRYTG